MLIRQGRDRSLVHDRRLACALALVAGALNSAGFYAVGVFSANMTGNVSILADRLALGDLLPGFFYLGILATFVLGAAVSALITSAGKHHRIHAIYALAVLAEAALLTALGFADLWLAPGMREPVLVFGLSFSMGLQNAIVTRISDARVRTTHISGMATDLGIELGCLLDIALRQGEVGGPSRCAISSACMAPPSCPSASAASRASWPIAPMVPGCSSELRLYSCRSPCPRCCAGARHRP